jgi:hypothetical protein
MNPWTEGHTPVDVRHAARTSWMIALGVALAAGGLSGCERDDPMERAAATIDRIVEKAGDKIEDAADAAGSKLERAGDKMEDKLDK